ncbi:MAG: hypothetical protein U0Q11_23950 [Vicinamibacterales bacterium]
MSISVAVGDVIEFTAGISDVQAGRYVVRGFFEFPFGTQNVTLSRYGKREELPTGAGATVYDDGMMLSDKVLQVPNAILLNAKKTGDHLMLVK